MYTMAQSGDGFSMQLPEVSMHEVPMHEVSMPITIPYDIIVAILDYVPSRYGAICSLNKDLLRLLYGRVSEFKWRNVRACTEVYARYWTLPNGAKHGRWEKLDDDKTTVVATSVYATGRHHGIKRKKSKDGGEIESETIYRYGQKVLTKTYYRGGQLCTTTPHVNGMKHGRQIRYSYIGNVIIVAEFQHDVQCGLFIEYEKRFVSVFEYANNAKHGAYYCYTYDGEIIESGEYAHGRRHAKWIEYHFDKHGFNGDPSTKRGPLKRITNYDNGVITDPRVAKYNLNGNVEDVMVYNNGVEDRYGYVSYHTNGKLAQTGYNLGQGITTNYRKWNAAGDLVEAAVQRDTKWLLVEYHDNGEIRCKRKITV